MKTISDKPVFISQFHKTYSGAVIAFLLFFLHWRITISSDPQLFSETFGASASAILRGEWYRCITALFLHGSDNHLAGNMAGIIIFGTSVCSITGSGIGWFLILSSGFLGNYFNALFYKSIHLSIGASTAVFGSIGILAGYRMIYSMEESGFKITSFIPVGAGLGLLALLGASPNSDIMAHLFGFFAGLIAGALYRLFIRKTASERVQYIFLLFSMAISMLCWVRGDYLNLS